jgi:hypothetical protein
MCARRLRPPYLILSPNPFSVKAHDLFAPSPLPNVHPAIGHRDFHWYSASQPSPASWFSGARRRPSSVCALPLEQVPQHLLGTVELMSPSSEHLAHRSSPAPSSFCCQTVPPGELTHRVPPVSFSSWKHLSHLRICVHRRLTDHCIDPLYRETTIHR